MHLSLDSLPNNKAKKIDLDGQPVCVVKSGDKVYAISDTCSHSDASLSEGDVRNGRIECWLHGAEFDLATGEAVTGPAFEPVETFKVTINGDDVEINKN
jgi:3-phenylpropionate/trans-cinnamate dioxygenase ferredoxin subunit